MSEEQLTAFLQAVKVDPGLHEKLEGAAGLDAAVSVAMEAGFELTKHDWVKAQPLSKRWVLKR
jgi:predicted ribosomally synthesized peptide with nif11-like leader